MDRPLRYVKLVCLVAQICHTMFRPKIKQWNIVYWVFLNSEDYIFFKTLNMFFCHCHFSLYSFLLSSSSSSPYLTFPPSSFLSLPVLSTLSCFILPSLVLQCSLLLYLSLPAVSIFPFFSSLFLFLRLSLLFIHNWGANWYNNLNFIKTF